MIDQAIEYRGPVYRGHNPRWSFPPESGEGAKRHGGRFNPRGVAALYTSERFETAWLEAQQGFSYKTQPLTIVTYQVQCAAILDLTNGEVLKTLEINPETLNCPWELLVDDGQTPPSQVLAKQLIRQGIAGICVPSFAHNAQAIDVNIIFWRWGDTLPHRVIAIDAENRLHP